MRRPPFVYGHVLHALLTLPDWPKRTRHVNFWYSLNVETGVDLGRERAIRWSDLRGQRGGPVALRLAGGNYLLSPALSAMIWRVRAMEPLGGSREFMRTVSNRRRYTKDIAHLREPVRGHVYGVSEITLADALQYDKTYYGVPRALRDRKGAPLRAFLIPRRQRGMIRLQCRIESDMHRIFHQIQLTERLKRLAPEPQIRGAYQRQQGR